MILKNTLFDINKMEFNKQQLCAIQSVASGKNVFITGQGGVGKSEIIKHITKEFEANNKQVAVTSLTGISALAIGGTTVHSWSGIGLGERDVRILISKAKNKSKEWRETNLLIIDEISMLSAELFEKLDNIGRHIRRNARLPFGGLQILLCGDFCQLPPVKQTTFCFESPSWKKCNFTICYLTINMRQSDARFQKLLTRARLGDLTEDDMKVLETRLCVKPPAAMVRPTKMFPKRQQVDYLNNLELNLLDAELKSFKAIDETDHKDALNSHEKERIKGIINKSCMASEKLILAVGAQVMLIMNMKLRGLVNGSRGVVVGFGECPVVKFLNGISFEVVAAEWEIKVSNENFAYRKQIPLILAYASTVHKVQGATLDYVEVDLGDDMFSEGQFYTALSRVRTLDGLFITSLDFSKVLCNKKVSKFYRDLERQLPADPNI